MGRSPSPPARRRREKDREREKRARKRSRERGGEREPPRRQRSRSRERSRERPRRSRWIGIFGDRDRVYCIAHPITQQMLYIFFKLFFYFLHSSKSFELLYDFNNIRITETRANLFISRLPILESQPRVAKVLRINSKTHFCCRTLSVWILHAIYLLFILQKKMGTGFPFGEWPNVHRQTNANANPLTRYIRDILAARKVYVYIAFVCCWKWCIRICHRNTESLRRPKKRMRRAIYMSTGSMQQIA